MRSLSFFVLHPFALCCSVFSSLAQLAFESNMVEETKYCETIRVSRAMDIWNSTRDLLNERTRVLEQLKEKTTRLPETYAAQVAWGPTPFSLSEALVVSDMMARHDGICKANAEFIDAPELVERKAEILAGAIADGEITSDETWTKDNGGVCGAGAYSYCCQNASFESPGPVGCARICKPSPPAQARWSCCP